MFLASASAVLKHSVFYISLMSIAQQPTRIYCSAKCPTLLDSKMRRSRYRAHVYILVSMRVAKTMLTSHI